MKINLIIGAGQLGSRHLQGLLKLDIEQTIYVLDPSPESLKISKSREEEINHNYEIHYISEWALLPNNFDLVIIATSANVRAKVVKQLMESSSVKDLILEKVLFQDVESYEEIGNLLKTKGVRTWVNHPRRLQSDYHNIKKVISKSNEIVMFDLFGTNWGLACNGLHFIDLVSFLSGADIDSIDADWVASEVLASKRKNFIELHGSVKGELSNGGKFILTCILGEVPDLTFMIATRSNRWIIDEGKQKIIHFMKDNSFCNIETEFKIDFQSTLTTRIANDLFESGNCNLPTYKEACASHIPFIKAILKKYTEITGIETTICPIT